MIFLLAFLLYTANQKPHYAHQYDVHQRDGSVKHCVADCTVECR